MLFLIDFFIEIPREYQMTKKSRKIQKPLIEAYDREEKNVLVISVLILLLIVFPDYYGQDIITTAMREVSGWMASWIPQLEVIASTRDNSVKTRIVLAFVIAMAPFHAVYFLLTMPAKVNVINLTVSNLVNKMLKAALAITVIFLFLISLLYVVLPISGDANPGHIAQRFIPILESNIGAGAMLLLASIGMAHMASVLLVLSYYSLVKVVNRERKKL